jgi:hypothetical protein
LPSASASASDRDGLDRAGRFCIVPATLIGLLVFLLAFGGALAGMWLRAVLPHHHVSAQSQDTIKISIGLIATMTALVLGLVTASAKSSFDAVEEAVKKTSTDIMALDRALARYGPETTPIRADVAELIRLRVDAIWPQVAQGRVDVDPARAGTVTRGEKIADAVRALQPADDLQRAMQQRASDRIEALLDTRWLALSADEVTIPAPFLIVMVFWLTITFTSFGLFAPTNATVVGALLLAALSVAGALFLVLELGSPFDGVVRTSPDPLLRALQRINH